jgi:ubiquinone/menaquinone biosynthesis C-methylase UbiE
MRKYTEETMKKIFGDFDPEEVAKNEKATVDWYKWKGADLTFYGNWQRDYAKLLIEIADLNSDPDMEWESILDVGCATGLIIRAIDELDIFKELYGVDISNYMIKELIPQIHADYTWNGIPQFTQTSCENLSMFENNTIDLLTCSHTLEHLDNEKKLHKTLKEFKRVLNKDGKLIIIIPTADTKNKDYSERADVSPLHHLAEPTQWWAKQFGKYFKSESYKARQIFKNSELKPDRQGELTFYEAYWRGWTVFRYVHK